MLQELNLGKKFKNMLHINEKNIRIASFLLVPCEGCCLALVSGLERGYPTVACRWRGARRQAQTWSHCSIVQVRAKAMNIIQYIYHIPYRNYSNAQVSSAATWLWGYFSTRQLPPLTHFIGLSEYYMHYVKAIKLIEYIWIFKNLIIEPNLFYDWNVCCVCCAVIPVLCAPQPPSLSHCPALPFSLSLSHSRDYVYTYATRLMTNNTPICSPAASFATQKQHFNHRTKRSQRSLDKRHISKKKSLPVFSLMQISNN